MPSQSFQRTSQRYSQRFNSQAAEQSPSQTRRRASQRITTSENQSSQDSPRRSQRPSLSQAQSQSSQVDAQNVERMVAEVVQYFLIMEQRKYPIKRTDVVKLLNLKGHSLTKIYKTVMTEVGKYLNDVFGYQIHEFDEKAGHYVIANQIVMPDGLVDQAPSESNTILFIVLSAIFLSGGQISEEEIWNMLNTLGYKTDDHKKLVSQDFVKQLYLNMECVPQSDPPKFNFEWGERASLEFSKQEILNFASKIYGQPPEQFGQLWNTAKNE